MPVRVGGVFVQEKSFAVIGGDGRQQAAAAALRTKGYQVYDAEKISLADYILLPMPLSAERAELTRLLKAAQKGAIAFAGRVSEEAAGVAKEANVELIDYLKREELAVSNAIPTCEGAIEILLRERSVTLWHSKILITGFGRIAKLLAHKLLALGAYVTVAARKPGDRALAEAMGYRAVDVTELAGECVKADVVINTVPTRMITRDMIEEMSKTAFLLDLASAPGGIDLAAAGTAEVRAVWALSLPTRSAPVTAGQFVAQTVLQIIEERGNI